MKNNNIKLEISRFEELVQGIKSPVSGIINLLEVLVDDWNRLSENSKIESLNDMLDSCRILCQKIEEIESSQADCTFSERHLFRYFRLKKDKVQINELLNDALAQVDADSGGESGIVVMEIQNCVIDADSELITRMLCEVARYALANAVDRSVGVLLNSMIVNGVEYALVTFGGIRKEITSTISNSPNNAASVANSTEQIISQNITHHIPLLFAEEVLSAHSGSIAIEEHFEGYFEDQVCIEIYIPAFIDKSPLPRHSAYHPIHD